MSDTTTCLLFCGLAVAIPIIIVVVVLRAQAAQRGERERAEEKARQTYEAARNAYLSARPCLTFDVVHALDEVRDVLVEKLKVGGYQSDPPLVEAIYYSEVGSDRLVITAANRTVTHWNVSVTLTAHAHGTAGRIEVDRGRGELKRWWRNITDFFDDARSVIASTDVNARFGGDTRLSLAEWRG